MTVKTVPFPGSYWVEPGKLLAGCYPGAQRLDEATRRLNALLDAGIRTIINLMEEYEIGWKEYEFEPYEEALQFLAQDRGFSVECLRVPVEDMDIPTYRVMKSILDTIDKAVEGGKPVYVHCWGGRGRTRDGRRVLDRQTRKGHGRRGTGPDKRAEKKRPVSIFPLAGGRSPKKNGPGMEDRSVTSMGENRLYTQAARPAGMAGRPME